jgi:hypothetical protein
MEDASEETGPKPNELIWALGDIVTMSPPNNHTHDMTNGGLVGKGWRREQELETGCRKESTSQK